MAGRSGGRGAGGLPGTDPAGTDVALLGQLGGLPCCHSGLSGSPLRHSYVGFQSQNTSQLQLGVATCVFLLGDKLPIIGFKSLYKVVFLED